MRRRLVQAVLVLALSAAAPAQAEHWVTAWGTAPDTAQRPGSTGPRSYRMVVRPALDGADVRVRLSNAYGRRPLSVAAVTLGERDFGASIVAGTLRTVRFGGRPGVTIPAGGSALSDPVAFPVRAGMDLAVSFHLASSSVPPTVHKRALTTGYVTRSGTPNATRDLRGSFFKLTVDEAYVVTGLDVVAPDAAGSVIALGDSLTDGTGATMDGHNTWVDRLGLRLGAQQVPIAIVNEGIGGNHVGCTQGMLEDGLPALARLDRDVLGHAGTRSVVIFEGTNDLASGCSGEDLIRVIEGLARQARAAGLRVLGATLLPRKDRRFSEAAERGRDIVNAWIRTGGAFDGVLDFDAAVRNGEGGLASRYDNGDGIHLNPDGYEQLAASVDLLELLPCAGRQVVVKVPPGAAQVRASVDGRATAAARSGRRGLRVTIPGGFPLPVTVSAAGTTGSGPFNVTARLPRCAP